MPRSRRFAPPEELAAAALVRNDSSRQLRPVPKDQTTTRPGTRHCHCSLCDRPPGPTLDSESQRLQGHPESKAPLIPEPLLVSEFQAPPNISGYRASHLYELSLRM